MKISLIICAYNEEKYIGQCLEYAIKNSNNQFYEIIVVDNASTDRTAQIAQTFPKVQVVNENAKGLTKARQKGLEFAKGDLLAYIDADTKMPEGWAEKVLKTFKKNENLICVSGPYVYYDVSKFVRLVVKIFWMFGRLSCFFGGYIVVGGNFVAKKEVLLEIGGFDTSISFYGEDTDIARRLSKVGKILFLKDLIIGSSARRLKGQGLIHTGYLYIINYFSILFKGKPVTNNYTDIR